MFNMSLISKDKVVVWYYFLGVSLWTGCTVMSELAIYRVEIHNKFYFITCKVLVKEWHDQHGWT